MKPETLLPYEEAPLPYDEHKDPDIFWKCDPGDKIIPSHKGFVTDFLYATRGIETPTIISLWSALFTLSTFIKREAWLKWFPSRLFSNDYIIVIGPAGIVKKSTAANIGKSIIHRAPNYIVDENLKKIKTISLITDKNSPESILNEMLPGKKGPRFVLKDKDNEPILGDDGRPMWYERTSEAAIHLSEMGSLFSKSNYMESLTSLLLDLYDNHETWIWNTLSRGKKILKRLHTGLFAAVTVDAFRSSIPKQALADGFMSRTALVYTPGTERCFPYPRLPRGAPSVEELSRRMAWLATTSMGQFQLSQKANKHYDNWYYEWKQSLKKETEYQGVRSRESIRILKVALLLKLQRYEEEDHKITETDIKDAIGIVEYTNSTLPLLLSEITDDGEFWKIHGKVSAYLKKKKEATRSEVLSGLRYRAKELDEIISQLIQERKVEVFNAQGRKQAKMLKNSSELYKWAGPSDEQT